MPTGVQRCKPANYSARLLGAVRSGSCRSMGLLRRRAAQYGLQKSCFRWYSPTTSTSIRETVLRSGGPAPYVCRTRGRRPVLLCRGDLENEDIIPNMGWDVPRGKDRNGYVWTSSRACVPSCPLPFPRWTGAAGVASRREGERRQPLWAENTRER